MIFKTTRLEKAIERENTGGEEDPALASGSLAVKRPRRGGARKRNWEVGGNQESVMTWKSRQS